MISHQTGAVTMLNIGDPRIENPPADHIVAFGAQEDIEEIGRRVVLGVKELDRRAARRKQQRESRRRNR